MFCSYAYPAANRSAERKAEPGEAWLGGTLVEFLLPYESVHRSDHPERMLEALPGVHRSRSRGCRKLAAERP